MIILYTEMLNLWSELPLLSEIFVPANEANCFCLQLLIRLFTYENCFYD